MAVTPEDLASTLLERERKKRAAHARRATELREKLAEWALRSRSEGLIGRAWLIGTLAKGNWGDASDVDIVVEGLDPLLDAQAWSELERLLEARVDLLRIEDLPGAFARRVLDEGVPL